MEEYLQYMKTLRSQMNDVEDQAAKTSVEEQMQLTNIRNLEKDIDSAKSEIKQLKEDTEKMMKAKGEICSKILETQKRIASLGSDTSKLTQTLELIQQERVGLSAKLSEKRAYYSKVAEDMSAKLHKQQEWIRAKKISRELKERELVKEKVDGQRSKAEGIALSFCLMFYAKLRNWKKSLGYNLQRRLVLMGSDARKNLTTELDSAKARLDEIRILKSKVLMENNKIKLAIEDVKSRENEFKPELKAADMTALEEEYNALLSDKAGETEYLQSLEKQTEKLKMIYHVVKCACGEEFTVATEQNAYDVQEEGNEQNKFRYADANRKDLNDKDENKESQNLVFEKAIN
ncbi:uncharacterized protein LOC133309021 [Gastrolobium bilobum]|uniref:uncharacterized protein LOC133309021 n=1 Tax=Gastrolobium bilobum TaxID=150636 RepID=UPI002AB193E1|nr:uncharacterized protein LOC133309021 [Gastrolobium bilobum]